MTSTQLSGTRSCIRIFLGYHIYTILGLECKLGRGFTKPYFCFIADRPIYNTNIYCIILI